MNEICSQYIKEVISFFPMYGKNEKKYINDLKITLMDYCEEESFSSINDLYDNFGPPNETAFKYYEGIDTDIIIKKIKRTNCIKLFVLAAVLGLFIYTSIHCINVYSVYKDAMANEIGEIITFIE